MDVVAAGGSSTTHLAQTMLVFLAQETDLCGPDVVGQTYHGPDVVGRHQMVGDDHGVRHTLEEMFRRESCEQVVGFQISHNRKSGV